MKRWRPGQKVRWKPKNLENFELDPGVLKYELTVVAVVLGHDELDETVVTVQIPKKDRLHGDLDGLRECSADDLVEVVE